MGNAQSDAVEKDAYVVIKQIPVVGTAYSLGRALVYAPQPGRPPLPRQDEVVDSLLGIPTSLGRDAACIIGGPVAGGLATAANSAFTEAARIGYHGGHHSKR